MSQTRIHSPLMAISGSFGLSIGRAEYVKEVEKVGKSSDSVYESTSTNEETLLKLSEAISPCGNGEMQKTHLNKTVLTTINVVTVDSSLQFVFGTGKVGSFWEF